ncbi:Ig-like domain-containing protein [Leptolyngbya sp. CCNP1308]|uniref:Ig-like domain-containing protein n=1 Tax=Leptolyngbya sp. CCNP1308 TaxID=3110255 RepID=UPI002B21E4D6|nr:Ig-like domain-containing protein [Leptolyngbya sp. CCNP1308]MEA5453006.1 Ig-like domain-containing protein [Leptolyngbya sp. CCNP1308]
MARRRSRRSRSQPLDRLAMTVIAGLSLALGLLILSGDHATARVRDFTWQDRQVGAEDQAFLLTFSRPMDVASVEQNLTLDPPLPGKVSWAGRRMAYTLTEPLPYGESFSVSLKGARDRYASLTAGASRFEPFQSQFETRPRAFLYIGAEDDEANRLVLADLSRQERTILTPKNLSVMAFEPYPLGDKVLFSASDSSQASNLLNQQIYTVTTGLTPRPPIDFAAQRPPLWQQLWPQKKAATSGETTLVLDSSTYQNLKFDLSADGQTIVVQRVNQQNPADFGPWIVRQGSDPQPIETEPGGDFLIAPDSQSLLLLQGQGTAIIDLGAEKARGPSQPLDFLPNYGRVLDLAADGSAAAMVNFNQDDPEKRFTESLFLVTNQGREEELLQVSGAIVDAQFDPTRQFLYVLASELVEAPVEADTLQSEDAYVEQPLLLVVTLADGETRPLLRLPQQQRMHMSVAPDGRSLLLDLARQTTPEGETGAPVIWHLPLVSLAAAASAAGADTTAGAAETEDRTEVGDAATKDGAGSMPTVTDPEEFPFSGLQATWLP